MPVVREFNFENTSEEEAKSFKIRQAVRGVVMDTDGHVALLYATKDNHYGLPGGGIEEGESIEAAIMRECKEEIGCEIEIVAPLGQTLEYRQLLLSINRSNGFLARLKGPKVIPVPEGDEAERGVIIEWVSLQRAIELLGRVSPTDDLYTQQVIQRDLFFLQEAQLKSKN